MPWLSRLFLHFKRPPVQTVYWRQLYFSGTQAALVCVIAGVSIAMVLYGLLHNSYGQSGDFILQILATVGLAELAPLLVAIILVARSASAMASELATMGVNGEIRYLRRMGITPLEYLVLPRILSTIAATLLLFIYFVAFMLLAGSVLASPYHPFLALYELAEKLPGDSLRSGLLRSSIYGAAIASIACWQALIAEHHSNAIPKAASRAVLYGLVAIFVLDALFNLS